MSIKETLQILLKAEDQASKQIKQVEKSLKNINKTKISSDTFSPLKRGIDTCKTSVKGLGQTTKGFFKNAKSDIKQMTNSYKKFSTVNQLAMGAGAYQLSQQISGLGQECLSMARDANKGWNAYKNAYQQANKGSKMSLDSMKSSVKSLASTTARSVGETRESLTQFMLRGMNYAQSMKAVYASSGLVASGFAKDEVSASKMIIQAMSGRGIALKRLGINIKDYQDKTTKTIDTERLLTDITNKTKMAQEGYANSMEGQSQKLDNAMIGLKSSIGSVMLEVIAPLIPHIQKLAQWLGSLPQPVKLLAGAFLLLVMAGTSLAPLIITLWGIKTAIGSVTGENSNIGKLRSGFDALKQKITEIPKSLDGIKSKLTGINISSTVDTAKNKLSSLKSTILDLGGKVKDLGLKFIDLGRQTLIAGYNALKSAGMWVIQKAQLIATSVAQGLATAGQWALNIAMSLNPITLVVLAIAGLIAVLVVLYMKCEPVRNVINAIGKVLYWLGVTVFNNIKSAIFNFINTIVQFGQRVKTGIQIVINTFLSLPGRIWSAICKLPGIIWNALCNAVEKAKQGGKKILDGIINFVKDIPRKVGEEFLKIPDRIMGAIGSAIDAAKNFGKKLIDNVLGVFGIHSPGIIQNNLANEFEALGGRINDTLPNALKEAKKFGNDVVDTATKNFNLKAPSVEAKVNSAPAPIPKTKDIGANKVNEDLTNIQEQAKANMDKIVVDVSNTLNIIRKKLTIGFNSNSNLVVNKMKIILYSLTKSTAKIVSSFETMKNGVVKSAKNMQTQTNTWVSKLKSNITSFYNNIRHPGGAGGRGAGAPVRSRRTGAGGGSSLAKLFKLDKTYFKGAKLRTINLDYLINGTMKKNGGAGGIFDYMIPKIKNNIRKARTGNAKVGRYTTSHLSFPVSSFEGSKPKISYEMFKALAEDIFSQISYDYYFDSTKYGSWQRAFRVGKMNCSDSSDALIALARACGLSASKVHGHWNNVGHFWANIAGHKMDTTGWMTRRTWTPSASHAGPAPKGLNPQNNANTVSNDSNNITVNGSITVVHDLKNVPSNIDENTLAELINSSTIDNPSWIRELVNNNRFQTGNKRVQDRLSGFNNRSAGV